MHDMCYTLVGYKTSRSATTFVVVLTAVMLGTLALFVLLLVFELVVGRSATRRARRFRTP